jgi:hypothetical protein
LAPQYQREWLGQYPWPACPNRPGRFRGDGGGAARDRGGVHQRQHLRGRRGGVGQPAQGGLHQRRDLPQPGVVLALGQQPREQVPGQARGSAASAARRRTGAGPAPRPGRRARRR